MSLLHARGVLSLARAALVEADGVRCSAEQLNREAARIAETIAETDPWIDPDPWVAAIGEAYRDGGARHRIRWSA